MNYCEKDGFHVIKLMAEVYLREIRMSLLLVWKCQHFSLEFLFVSFFVSFAFINFCFQIFIVNKFDSYY